MSVNGADLTEQDYLDVAAAAVAAARQAGAEEAEAAVGAGNDFSATVRQGKTEKLLESGSKGLSLRVFAGGGPPRSPRVILPPPLSAARRATPWTWPRSATPTSAVVCRKPALAWPPNQTTWRRMIPRPPR